MATRKGKGRGAAKLSIAEEIHVEIGEASAVVPLGGRLFLVADDESGVRLVDASGKKASSKVLIAAGDDDRVAGLEGMCIVAHGTKSEQHVLAVRESDGATVSLAFSKTATNKPVVREHGSLVRPPDSPGKKNKGWEGIAFLDAAAAYDKRPHLVAVHEGKPRALGVFSFPALKLERTIAIEGELDELLPDLSDIAVHPESGELWILSDESEHVARVKLTKSSLELVASHAIPVEDGEKPEGIAFDESGALWLVTDDTGRLLRLELV